MGGYECKKCDPWARIYNFKYDVPHSIPAIQGTPVTDTDDNDPGGTAIYDPDTNLFLGRLRATLGYNSVQGECDGEDCLHQKKPCQVYASIDYDWSSHEVDESPVPRCDPVDPAPTDATVYCGEQPSAWGAGQWWRIKYKINGVDKDLNLTLSRACSACGGAV